MMQAKSRRASRNRVRCPSVNVLVRRLFGQTWTSLGTGEDSPCLADPGPGVYILAYQTRHLQGKPIRPRDIYYVGMSHAGVGQRLKQFRRGLEDGGITRARSAFFGRLHTGCRFRS